MRLFGWQVRGWDDIIWVAFCIAGMTPFGWLFRRLWWDYFGGSLKVVSLRIFGWQIYGWDEIIRMAVWGWDGSIWMADLRLVWDSLGGILRLGWDYLHGSFKPRMGIFEWQFRGWDGIFWATFVRVGWDSLGGCSKAVMRVFAWQFYAVLLLKLDYLDGSSAAGLR